MNSGDWKFLKKGIGIIVAIPGDEHDGIQNRRPGIVINSNSEYITVQLLSSRSNSSDFYSFKIAEKIQYVRTIYLKNIPLNQIKGFWWVGKNLVQLNLKGKVMQEIQKNPYKAAAITLSLNEYLEFKNEILKLQKENEQLKVKAENLLKFLEENFERDYIN